MGHESINVSVADAGPVIHLAEIGCLSLLGVFECVHIPEAVWIETVGLGRVVESELVGRVHIQ